MYDSGPLTHIKPPSTEAKFDPSASQQKKASDVDKKIVTVLLYHAKQDSENCAGAPEYCDKPMDLGSIRGW